MGYTISNNQSGVKKGYVRYRFDVYHPFTGKRERKQLTCQRSVVENLYRYWERQLLEESSGKFLLFEKLDEYLGYSILKKSKKHYLYEKSVIEGIVKKFFKKETLLSKINKGDVEDFIVWRRKYIASPSYSRPAKLGIVTNATINRNLSVLQYFYKYCIKKQYCSSNPFCMSKLKENNYREITLTQQQINELLKKAQELDIMFYNAVRLLIGTGMRSGELFSLRWDEIDFEKSIIMLSGLKTKSKRRRMIPITPIIRETLLSLMKSQSELILLNYIISMFRRHWRILLKKINFNIINDGSSLRIHDMRHIYAQTLSNDGVPMEDIQALLGHQDLSTTQRRYAMFARPDLLEKASKIDRIIQ